MNVLEKILKEIEERVNFRERLVKYEKRRGTVTDVCRNKGALEELDIVAEIIRSHMDEAKDTNVPSNEGWISVEERLPEEKMEVLCCFENGTVQSLWQNWKNDGLGDYFDDDLIPTEVIAWQPLPEPYKPKEKVKKRKNTQQEIEDFWRDK